MQPLVSVGIPTYNRPEGLKRTLEQITCQTYKNIEIIISDNFSTNPGVKEIVDEFENKDKRIISYVQTQNIGGVRNFKFVLEKASGTYFMWAADDDEWEAEFIEELVSKIGDRSAAFCNYSIVYRSINKVENSDIYKSASGVDKYEQARNFLLERVPSMYYSIFKKEDIIWFLDEEAVFDWFDCYAIFRIILLSNGVALSKKRLFKAGIEGAQYENKPFNPSKEKTYTYSRYIKKSVFVIFRSKMSFLKKIKLCFYLLDVNSKSFLSLEKKRRHYKRYLFLYKILSSFTPRVKIIRLY